MTCLALDDEPLALHVLETFLLRLPALRPQGFFSDPDAARARIGRGDIDLLFLDIHMPDGSGLEFLRGISEPPLVIFTTAYAEFAVEGFNLEAVDYLLKPFSFERFQKAVQRALDYHQLLKNRDLAIPGDMLVVRSSYTVVPVRVDQIVYLESLDDYVKIHMTRQSKPILTLTPLKTLLGKLPPGSFLRVHRSFAVAIFRVQALRRGKICLDEGLEIPVGDTFMPAVRRALGNV